MLETKTDEELMVAYQLGDEAAFLELYRRYSKRVFVFLRKKLSTEAVADDVFQSTFLKIHKSRSKYNVSIPFVAWVFTICRSEMLDAIKKQRRSQEDSVADILEFEGAGIPLEADASSQVDLSALTSKQQEALQLRYGQGFSFQEIARELETTSPNARQIVSRAIQYLRRSNEKK
jgi:RNA polymerase sigma factor (sigma-70 family)